ncbi:MAG TPA: hypothetical protein VNK44_04655 [Candidatus Nitrosotenuis sp.]|nr:hypothetical protein [Candidatus Nitrosotenuis sp.]
MTTSQISDTFVPNPVLDIYHKLEKNYENRLDWARASEEQLWKELCFCILSGNVAFELAKSVVEVLTERGYLDYRWMREDRKSRIALFHELDKPNFDPRKKNGELRKYRYPRKRSAEIVSAAKTIYVDNSSIKNVLSSSSSDIEARNFFVNQISGLGIKEASHFLRNIGFADSLAIIDVHVLSFLKEFSLVDFDANSLTPQRYLRLEKTLRNFVDYHGLNLAIFDLAVWYYMRNREL